MTRIPVGSIPLIGQKSPEQKMMQDMVLDFEFSLFTRFIDFEYQRARIDLEKAKGKDKNAKLDVNVGAAIKVAQAATHAFLSSHFGGPKKQEAAEAKDIRKEAEAATDAKPAETPASPIVMP